MMSFFEIVLILVVALLVLGPKRLTRVAKNCAKLVALWKKNAKVD